MKKIIIFGSTGNIGAYFTSYCREKLDVKYFQTVATGRRSTSFFLNNGIEYYVVDVTKEEDFFSLPKEDVYAVVILSGLLPAYSDPSNIVKYSEVNIVGTLRILEYARNVSVDRVLYTQTWADLSGYWGVEEILRPDMPIKLSYSGDHAFYTISKTTIVESLKYYYEEFGLKYFIFRLPNIYLYNPQKYYLVDGEKRFISYRFLIDRAISGMPIEMWGNPNAFKDIIYIKDLCQMMYKALFAKVDFGIYNAGTGIKTTFREQLEGIVEVFSPTNKKSEIIEKPDKPSFTSFVMDIDNAKEDLGYYPEYTYKKYLEDYKVEMQMNRFRDLNVNE